MNDGQRVRSSAKSCRRSFSGCRWFGAKARTIRELQILERIPISEDESEFWFLELTYARWRAGDLRAPGPDLERRSGERRVRKPRRTLSSRDSPGQRKGFCMTRFGMLDFANNFFVRSGERKSFKGKLGDICAASPRSVIAGETVVLTSHVLIAEQSNSSMLFENTSFLKLYRKLEDGVNPDVETHLDS